MFYLDNAATTAVLPGVLKKSLPYLTDNYGNPSSIHRFGIGAARAVNEARLSIARTFQLPTKNIIFCGSGTESNNLALYGIAGIPNPRSNQIIVSNIEHPCVLKASEMLQKQGFQVNYIRASSQGLIDVDHLETLISENTRLVSCMAVNNEIGTLQPLHEIGKVIKQKNPQTLFHVDAVQAFTKVALSVKKYLIDLLSISGHKIGAPKGIGALILVHDISLAPVIVGGGQEYGIRSGTENVFAIVAFGEAVYLKEQRRISCFEALKKYRQNWLEFLANEWPQVNVFQSPHVLPYFLNLALPSIPAEVFLHHLESENIFVSAGSACSSRKIRTSHVLQAIGMKSDVIQSMIRLSFSEHNLSENQEELFHRFSRAIAQLEELL